MEGFSNADHIFENILQGITDSVLLLSKDLEILWANEAFQNQTGYKRKEIIGNYCYKLTHHQEVPCQSPHDLCPIVEALENGRTATTIHTHFDKEGNKIFVEVSAYPLKDEKGNIIQFVYIYRDITDMKRLEEELRISRDELEIRVEERTEELAKYQYHLEELVEERTAKLKAATENLQQEITERMKMEEALRKSYGELEIRVKERTAELEKVNVELLNEIAERKRIEEALRRGEARLTEAQRIAHLGNWDWNIQTNQLYWSDEIYRIFGLSPQQFGATYEAFLDFVYPNDREFVKEAVNNALFENKPYSIDHRIVLPDGTVRIVHEQAEVTFNEAGNPIRMIGTVLDITDNKKAEEELKESYGQLRELSAHLRSVREEERTNIAREIHDELGQVLTALKIDVSMLSNKLYPDSKLLEKTESIIKRIDETIQSVKRICAELRPTILDHFGLSAAIEWHVEGFESRTGIKCDVPFEPREIVLDQDLTTSVFRICQEALTNVARHANATEVKISLRLKDGNIRLEVRDNGKGFKEKQFSDPKSFGLIGIKERVNFLGGNVKINGIRDKGTTITINIPLRKKEEPDDKNINR
ncbi:MAG TPA: PAS domain-containing protein [Thermodesulfovibrionales bacterium]|nr:PAS domain-containing protein [Thermodesulfovibrionales bacterium]